MTPEAYGQAYCRSFKSTIRLLQARGARTECATETAQAAWAKGWERIGQLRNEQAVSTWVNSIALNCYRREIRSEHLQQPLPELTTEADFHLAAIDIGLILSRCLPRDRKLLEYSLQGHRLDEIARMQGVSYAAVRIRLLRARRAARSRAGFGGEQHSMNRLPCPAGVGQ